MPEKVIANIRFWVDGHRPPDQVLEGSGHNPVLAQQDCAARLA